MGARPNSPVGDVYDPEYRLGAGSHANDHPFYVDVTDTASENGFVTQRYATPISDPEPHAEL